MPAIPAARREAVAQRAGRRCEYCGFPAGYSSAAFEVEHIIPPPKGGSDEEENLALACRGCNAHKSIAIAALDPETGEFVRLYNPRQDAWSEHFEWQADYTEISGLSAIGRATVNCLRMNRLEVINLRLVLVAFGVMPPPAN